MAIATGTRLGRYEIVSRLGAGGMGEVYRARDTRLEREVAVKVLPPDFAEDRDRVDRFEQEARAAGRLNHPHITTVYDVGTHEGTTYLVSELLEGETLGAVLERGPLSPRKAVGYGVQIARGLAAAHEAGIVHRDLKPDNLFIQRGGRVKILDFGLAKLRQAGTEATAMSAATATAPHQVMGTAAYMAPEQIRAQPVDSRSDLFAFGAVLYEMLAGRRAFAGASAMEAIGTILTGDPPPLGKQVSGLPPALEGLIYRCLEKDPEERFQSARDLGHALEALSALPGSGPREAEPAPASEGESRKRALRPGGLVGLALLALAAIGALVWYQVGDRSERRTRTEAAAEIGRPADDESLEDGRRFLAVLPFANTSPDRENEYFADGVTDDILTHLAQVPDFSVISRTTTMGYKESDRSVQQIAEELGVQYVLEGSVRRAGDQVRITAQLVDGREDQHLWADSYDRRFEDIFAVQTEIAQAIVEALEVQLSRNVASRIERRPTEDLEAYELFLLGRESLYLRDLEGTERAMELFSRALERDPKFALARAWLARALVFYAVSHGMGVSWADSAVADARQAISEQPDLADAYSALGSALTFTGRYEEAEAALEHALKLNRNDSIAARHLGVTYTRRGFWDEAIRVTRSALEFEGVRLTSDLHSNLAWYSLQLGLLDQAQAAIETALTLGRGHPSNIANRAWIELLRGERDAALLTAERLAGLASALASAGQRAAQLFIWLGEIERAREVAEAAYAQSPTAYAYHESILLGVLYGYALESSGEPERGSEMLAETERYALERIAAGDELNALRYSLAAIHALRGETDEAFRWLDEAIHYGWNVAAITALDPLLESLGDDPRFQAALDRMERSLAPMRTRVEQEGW